MIIMILMLLITVLNQVSQKLNSMVFKIPKLFFNNQTLMVNRHSHRIMLVVIKTMFLKQLFINLLSRSSK